MNPRLSAGLLLACTLLLIHPAPLPAAEARIHYQALRKVLLQQVFKQGGRHFLYGGSDASCRHALLENPVIAAAPGGRLRVTAQFRGRAGVELGGECVGATDAFQVVMSGVPVYRSGELLLDQLQVETPRPIYNDLIRGFFRDTLARAFRYPLLSEVRQAAADASRQGPYQVQVAGLEVRSIRPQADALEVVLDFSLNVQ
ncbi:hypothetical protein DESUT3_35200 [Desulfuromonas versatilis]|uniref:Uncharacterized protein n=1 Tax=Desulfuromonas versatilis TaxID=2802975 RepID=A0ABN6E297_9BACT|nr:hypothetical protein [Desulfuromonas versatilis]BCR06451.1 hypothetical protein DESUT3_35200 [Desulfuromonas versatilis]